MKDLRIISFTAAGTKIGVRLAEQSESQMPEAVCFAPAKYADDTAVQALPSDIGRWIGNDWGQHAYLFVGAVGIAIRYIAPWIQDKFHDPAILCMDERGRYVIPLLSGHVGGAVELAGKIANITGGVPVITTATDVNDRFAVDVFARKNQLKIQSRELAKKMSAFLLDGGRAGFYSEYPIRGICPKELVQCESERELAAYESAFAVTGKKGAGTEGILYLIPQNLIVGIGCRRGTPKELIQEGLFRILSQSGCGLEQVSCIASIDLKKEERGLNLLARELEVPFYTFTAEELLSAGEVSCSSEFVRQVTGVDNVCERAAILAAEDGELTVKKTIINGVTYAIVRKNLEMKF